MCDSFCHPIVGGRTSISPLPEGALLFRDLYLQSRVAAAHLAALAVPLFAPTAHLKAGLGLFGLRVGHGTHSLDRPGCIVSNAFVHYGDELSPHGLVWALAAHAEARPAAVVACRTAAAASYTTVVPVVTLRK